MFLVFWSARQLEVQADEDNVLQVTIGVAHEPPEEPGAVLCREPAVPGQQAEGVGVVTVRPQQSGLVDEPAPDFEVLEACHGREHVDLGVDGNG